MFKNLKEGDEVLAPIKIHDGSWTGETFYIKQAITRVTKAQFEVNGRKYWRKNGSLVGASSGGMWRSNDGDCYPLDNCLGFTDQTDEAKAHKVKVHAKSNINKLGEKLQGVKIDQPNITEINELCEKIKNLLKIN